MAVLELVFFSQPSTTQTLNGLLFMPHFSLPFFLDEKRFTEHSPQ
jgi:hypothetical protein